MTCPHPHSLMLQDAREGVNLPEKYFNDPVDRAGLSRFYIRSTRLGSYPDTNISQCDMRAEISHVAMNETPTICD